MVSAQSDKTIICRGDFANLKALTVDASNSVKFKWSNTQETAVCAVMPDFSSSYTVTVTDTGGCSATSTINIEVKQPPVLNFTSRNVGLCAGAPARLNAIATGGTPSYKYYWSPASGLDRSDIANPQVTSSASTQYGVTVIDGRGCTVSDAVNVKVITPPLVSITPGQTDICAGDRAKLTAIVKDQNLAYKWSNGLTTNTIDVSPVSKFSYTVTVADSLGCSATAAALVNVNTRPAVSIAPLKVIICPDSTVQLLALAKGGTAPYKYSWSNGSVGAENIKVSPSSSSPYNVTITDDKGCTATATVMVTVNSPITATINYPRDTVCLGDKIMLSAKVSGTTAGYSFKWSHISGGQANAYAQPTNTTTYHVTATETSFLHCSTSASATLYVRDTALKPTAIFRTPANGLAADGSVTLAVQGEHFGRDNRGAHWVWYQTNLKGQPIDSFRSILTVKPGAATTYLVRVEGGCNNTAPLSINVTGALKGNPPKPALRPEPIPDTKPHLKPGPGSTAQTDVKPAPQPVNQQAEPEVVRHDTIVKVAELLEVKPEEENKMLAAQTLYGFLQKYAQVSSLKQDFNPLSTISAETANAYRSLFDEGITVPDELRPSIDGAPTTVFASTSIESYINNMVQRFPKGLQVVVSKASIDFMGIMQNKTATIYIEKIVKGVAAKPNGLNGTSIYKSHLFEVLTLQLDNDFSKAKVAKVVLVKGSMACLDCDNSPPEPKPAIAKPGVIKR